MTSPRPGRGSPSARPGGGSPSARPGGQEQYRRPRRADDAVRRGAIGSGGPGWSGPTDRIPRSYDVAPRAGTDRARPSWADRALRGLAGVLAGGLVVLALGITVVWFGADSYGLPGPGTDVLVGHWAGAVLAVAGQRVADRRPDRTGTLAALLVLVVTALVLGFAWFL